MDKQIITDKLEQGKIWYDELKPILVKIDKRLDAYVYSNLFDPDSHGMYEKLAVVRFLSFFYKYDLNLKEVKKVINFCDVVPIESEKGVVAYPLIGFQIFFSLIYMDEQEIMEND